MNKCSEVFHIFSSMVNQCDKSLFADLSLLSHSQETLVERGMHLFSFDSPQVNVNFDLQYKIKD